MYEFSNMHRDRCTHVVMIVIYKRYCDSKNPDASLVYNNNTKSYLNSFFN